MLIVTRPDYRAIVTALAWTGLRVSEVLALRWDDIDFDDHDIRVRYQLDEKGELKRPKTKAGARSVPLLPVLETELREHRKQQFSAAGGGRLARVHDCDG